MTPVAAKRLKAIEEYSHLGAGFKIAMRDLEIRGAGNILGPEQSGHIATVGYEMYCQLLEEAVRQLKNEPKPVTPEAHVEIGITAFIPKTYIPGDRQRMDVYRRLTRCTSVEMLVRTRAGHERRVRRAAAAGDVAVRADRAAPAGRAVRHRKHHQERRRTSC